MDEPSYDSRLEPRQRRRDPEEIQEILSKNYEEFLKGKTLLELMQRLLPSEQSDAIFNVIEMILENDYTGERDVDFQKTVDRSSLEYELS